jgi:hypothetical protein
MSEFTDTDARLGAMHGDQAMRGDVGGGLNGEGRPVDVGRRRELPRMDVEGRIDRRVEDAERLARLEAKVDALILALRAGAIGDWRAR